MNPKRGDAASASRPSTTTISIRLAAASAGVIILTFIAFVLFAPYDKFNLEESDR